MASTAACRSLGRLGFCNQVDYAAPGPVNGDLGSAEALGRAYDRLAEEYYQNFTRLLGQLDCTAHYSYERNCDDCARAYKDWLCAVTVPRCTTTAANTAALNLAERDGDAMRAIRGTAGKWTEVMPCVGLCYRMVQSCPAYFKFSCPAEDRARSASYGVWVNSNQESSAQCNSLGVDVALRGVPTASMATRSKEAAIGQGSVSLLRVAALLLSLMAVTGGSWVWL
ncbi:stretch-activated Ca2+-permeable channel component-domain-containing protein [Thamnocephalis sphaerospora]|uniref:Stretch-activated Ca2+-permeable channel component-domain-containing protein n=1 Tax=Thamnocephalis sphaerospora TaxID=78915 RepID=A0A4P9XPW8_9FUNG|nr:stretch-activated Ca2+-permeable channel component-domain-containing protein [Thamnocephalis sphaerospora]|eukprot:RKP08056.1 stretch-activated Ca2+-permeable channel component-domain-containing protein [Thamnocephalis sphaerospora]